MPSEIQGIINYVNINHNNLCFENLTLMKTNILSPGSEYKFSISTLKKLKTESGLMIGFEKYGMNIGSGLNFTKSLSSFE